jgi:beta-mannosidase
MLGLVLLLPALLGLPASADVVNLASFKWTLTNANGTINVPSTGPPNEAHLDLVNAGIITEPLLGINGSSDSFSMKWYIDTIITRFYPTLGRR